MRTARYILPILLVITLIGLSALPGHASPPRTNPGTTNLIACWRLQESSGTRNDSHSINHLTDNNTVGASTGKVGNAALFASAQNEYLSITDNASLSTGDIDYSIAFWVNISSKSAFQIFAVKGSSTVTAEREYVIGYNNSSDRFLFRAGNGTTTNFVSADNLGAPSTSTWYFVVAKHIASSDQLYIRINGGTANTISYSGGSYDSTYPFAIGALSDGTFGTNGMIDEFVFYKKNLTTAEEDWLYNSGSGRACADVIATATPTNTLTFTPSNTATFTPSNTATFTPSNTATFTPSNTFTPTVTKTFTPTDTLTFTPSKTFTPTATASRTPTRTPTDVDTPTNTFTPSPTATETATYTPTATATETLTPTVTLTPTLTFTPGPTRTPGNIATAFWDGAITYGDTANVIVTSLLCLVVVLGLMSYLILTNLQRNRKR